MYYPQSKCSMKLASRWHICFSHCWKCPTCMHHNPTWQQNANDAVYENNSLTYMMIGRHAITSCRYHPHSELIHRRHSLKKSKPFLIIYGLLASVTSCMEYVTHTIYITVGCLVALTCNKQIDSTTQGSIEASDRMQLSSLWFIPSTTLKPSWCNSLSQLMHTYDSSKKQLSVRSISSVCGSVGPGPLLPSHDTYT